MFKKNHQKSSESFTPIFKKLEEVDKSTEKKSFKKQKQRHTTSTSF